MTHTSDFFPNSLFIWDITDCLYVNIRQDGHVGILVCLCIITFRRSPETPSILCSSVFRSQKHYWCYCAHWYNEKSLSLEFCFKLITWNNLCIRSQNIFVPMRNFMKLKVLRANTTFLGGTQNICERTQKHWHRIFPPISY